LIEPSIDYNLLLEFHSFLRILAYYDEFKEDSDLVQPDPFVEELIESTRKDLTPMMSSDLKLFYRDSILLSYGLISNWTSRKASTYSDFRKELEQMNADDFIRLILDDDCCDRSKKDETEEEAFERMERELKAVDNDESILNGYRELKKYPEETMSRIRHFLDHFYINYFQKAEPEIEAFLKEKVKSHRELYRKDSKMFHKAIIKVSFEEQCGHDVDYHFTLGYLNGATQSYTPKDCRVFCYYGHLNERFLDPEYYDRQMTDFFKMLSDETRLKMLRMMAEKSWYASEMAEELDINKATVSYHMKMFNRFNIVDISLGKNKRIYYRTDRENIEERFLGYIRSLGGE